MTTAEHIRAHRVRAGKSAQQVAADLAINDAWYSDLERRGEELETTLTLFQAMHLAALLNVKLKDFFPDETAPSESIALIDLPALVAAHLRARKLSAEEFGEQIGWDLGGFMKSPVQTTSELPLAFVRALCAPLGINWLAVIPAD